jgi:hypothetical protein
VSGRNPVSQSYTEVEEFRRGVTLSEEDLFFISNFLGDEINSVNKGDSDYTEPEDVVNLEPVGAIDQKPFNHNFLN